MSDSIKVGRVAFGSKKDGWTGLATVWFGKKYGDFTISFSKPPPEEQQGKWSRGTDVRYDDGEVISIKGKFPKLFLDDGYKIVGPGLEVEGEEAPFSPDDNTPF